MSLACGKKKLVSRFLLQAPCVKPLVSIIFKVLHLHYFRSFNLPFEPHVTLDICWVQTLRPKSKTYLMYTYSIQIFLKTDIFLCFGLRLQRGDFFWKHMFQSKNSTIVLNSGYYIDCLQAAHTCCRIWEDCIFFSIWVFTSLFYCFIIWTLCFEVFGIDNCMQTLLA